MPITEKKLSVIKRLFGFETISSLKKKIQDLETEKRKTENYLNNIIRFIPANIYWKDKDCVILGGNFYHAKQAGFSDPNEVVGKTDHDFVWKDGADDVVRNDRKVIESGIGCQFEEIGTLSDGKQHTFLTSKEPLRDSDGNIIGLIGISTDITDFKELQQQLLEARMLTAEAATRASNAKAVAEEEMRKTIMILVGDIVHDLRTPITAIKSIADLLEKMLPLLQEFFEEAESLGATKINLLSKKNWEYLFNKTPVTDIQNSILMMNDFIDTTLTELANAEKSISSELTQEQLTQHSSSRVIENTMRAYPFADNERDKVTLNCSYDFLFKGNSILLMKLLFNLIKNALEQIASNGTGEIIISTGAEEGYNLINIKDTAGGASPEIISQFFTGYFTTKKNGTGIGLAFCKKTMLSFGGDLVCQSIYGESIEFTLKFPPVF